MFRPTHNASFAMAKTNFAMATTEIYGIVIVLIVNNTRSYGGKGDNHYNCYSKIHTSDSKNNTIYNVDIVFIAFNYVNNNYAI